MSEEFVTLVVAMRELQKEYFELSTRLDNKDRWHRMKMILPLLKKAEQKVDIWIQKHIAERVQLELWTRSVKSSETPGVYDVDNEKQKEKNGSA